LLSEEKSLNVSIGNINPEEMDVILSTFPLPVLVQVMYYLCEICNVILVIILPLTIKSSGVHVRQSSIILCASEHTAIYWTISMNLKGGKKSSNNNSSNQSLKLCLWLQFNNICFNILIFIYFNSTQPAVMMYLQFQTENIIMKVL
jgi:hypothetical protein